MRRVNGDRFSINLGSVSSRGRRGVGPSRYLLSSWPSIVLRRRLTDYTSHLQRRVAGPDRTAGERSAPEERRADDHRGRYAFPPPAAEAPPFAALTTGGGARVLPSPGGRVGGNIGSVVWVRRGVVVSSLQSSVRRVVLHGVLAAASGLQRTPFRLRTISYIVMTVTHWYICI